MEPLRSPIRGYDWGSRSVIAAIQGRPVPSAGPEAELWIGAHPDDPSTVDRPGGAVSLADVVGSSPEAVLGASVAGEFGARLPYMLKLLAADAALSLQAHPDAAQARRGYAAEEAAGLSREGGERNYVDPYPKPELLVAVTEFEALCGFQEPKVSAEMLGALAVPALEPLVAALRGGVEGLSEVVRALLEWPAEERGALVEAVVAGGVRAGADHPYAAEYATAGRLAARYPGDVGVLVALLLNHVTLKPGEAIWMPAGNLHTYLRGTGVEALAASDNVLRGGLTPKRIDVAELLRVLRYEVLTEPVLRPFPVAPGIVTWPTPAREFALYRVRLDAAVPRAELALDGPRLALCLGGEVRVDDGDGGVTLGSGGAAFGRAVDRPLALAGSGDVFVAAVPGPVTS
jgi:mannose-6-phosphate isomerase